MQVATTAPQTSRGFLTVGPDMAKVLTVVFRAFPMQVATTAPQISRGLLAVGPEMAKVLTVVFRAFPMQVATTAPQTSRVLLTVGPDMAKVLTVVAMHKSSLSFLWFYIDDNIVQAIQLEYLLRFYVSC
jgi:hypothetical protein